VKKNAHFNVLPLLLCLFQILYINIQNGYLFTIRLCSQLISYLNITLINLQTDRQDTDRLCRAHCYPVVVTRCQLKRCSHLVSLQ